MSIEAMTKHPDAKPDFVDEAGNDCYRVSRSWSNEIIRVPSGTPVQRYTEMGSMRRNETRERLSHHFENSFVQDDCLVIPIDDVAKRIIAGSDPVALAQSLWAASEDVCEAFMEALTRRYSDGSLSDAQRRKFLTKVQTEVWAVSLDKAVDRMETYDAARRDAFRHREIIDALRYMAAALIREINHEAATLDSVRRSDGVERVVKWLDRVGKDCRETEVVGADWRETREFWRRAIVEKFPEPFDPGVVNVEPETREEIF